MKSMQYITLFVFCLLFLTSDIHASIPEPDTLIYGKIFNTYQNNSLPVKQGSVAFTIRKKSSTQELTYHSEIECLKCLEYDDGACIHCENFSYVIKIPQKSSLNSQDKNDESLDLSTDNVQFDYVAATVNGKQAKILPKTHFGNIAPEDKEGNFILVGQPRRCHVYNVDLALVMEISDSDNDGLPDIWENFHALNPESPDDASLDNDNDGWTNLEEFNNGTNPSISNQLPTLLEDTFQVFEGGISIFRLNIADSDTSDDNINIQFVSAPQGIELVFYGKDAPYEHGHILEYNDSVTLKDLNEGNLLIKCNTSLHESNEIKLLILDDQLNPIVANIQLDVFSPSATNATDAILWADAFDYANKKQEGTALPKRISDRSGNTHHGDFYTGTEDDQEFSSTEIQLDDNALPTGKAVIKQNGYFELPYAAPVFPNGNMTIISAFKASGNDNQILASGPHYEIGVTGKKHPLHPGELRFATESKAIYSNIPVIDDFILATTLITSDKTFIEINGLWTGGPYSLDEQTRLGTDPILGGKVVWEWDFRDMAWIGNFSDIMDGQFAEMIVFDRQLDEHEKWPIYAHFLTKWFGYVVCDFSHASQDIDLRATSGDKSEKVRQRKLDADQAWLAYSDAYFNNEGIEDALTLLESYLPDGWQWSVNPPDVDEALAAMDAIKYDYQKNFVNKFGNDYAYMLIGGMGDDTIIGGYENDFIIGGPGEDTLIGCQGRDIFVVNDGDTVIDFNVKDGDVLYLNHLIDHNGHSLSAHIHFELGSDPITTENITILSIDSNGDGSGYDDVSVILRNVLFRDSIDLTKLWANGNLHTSNTRPDIQVGLIIKKTEAIEITEDPAAFELIFSEKNLPTNLSVPLKIEGTAIIGQDYFIEVPVWNDDIQQYENKMITNNVIPVKIKPQDHNIQVNIVPIFDNNQESPETIILSLLSKKEYYNLSDHTGGTIVINDGIDEISIQSIKDSVVEGSTIGGMIEITRKGSIDIDKVVNLMFQGTAENGKDYYYVSAEITIPAGDEQSQIHITPYNDNETEQIEFAEVIVSNGDYKVKGPASARISILDKSQQPVILGNIDLQNDLDLKDAILCLQILKGGDTDVPVYVEADINNDTRLGIEEVIYILHIIASNDK